MKENKKMHMIAFTLLIIGGLNWLLVGLFKWDVGHLLGGMDSLLSRVIYTLVGLSAIYIVSMHKGDCKICSGSGNMGSSMNEGQK